MSKLLVVDDEHLLRRMLKDVLEEAGHTVIVAEDGRAAITSAKADPPDCILLDIMMPGLDGYETCAALKADPRLAAVPVILITATTDLRVIDRAEQVGATTVLPKPFPIEQLEQALILALNPPQP
jgi:twitching motility two-component system response regulator PilG